MSADDPFAHSSQNEQDSRCYAHFARVPCLDPATVQEAIDLTMLAFDLADKYRTIATVLLDGNIGQLMEPAELPPMRELRKEPPAWAVAGAKGRKKNIVSSIHLQPEELETFNRQLQAKLKTIAAHEVRYKEYMLEGAELIVVGFGTAGRVAQTESRG